MKTILVLGGTGMLGSAVGHYFQSHPEKYETFLTTRDMELCYGKKSNWVKFDPTGKTPDSLVDITEVLYSLPKNPDYVVCCIGVIKPFMGKSKQDSIFINSLLPHSLAESLKVIGSRMIHITSDCTFAGFRGAYNESDPHDALDDYGKSKSLGEPTSDAMVIRTSIIGPEIHKQASLIAWAQSNAGKDVNGFTNHWWNGITCKQYASICAQIIDNDLYEPGLFHVHSDTVTKEQLLHLINEKYNLNLKIHPVKAESAIDRTLTTQKALLGKLYVPSIKEQIEQL